MIKYIIIILVLVLGIWFFTRGGNVPEEKLTVTNETEQAPGASEVKEEDIKKAMIATLHTNKGDIKIELFTEETPVTVGNFVKLAKNGFYSGVKFHRVIKDFMIQGGDPLTKDDSKMDAWGSGGPGYTFPDEIGPNNRNNIGTISMANAGPNTNGSQFFINTANNNFLDEKHTVFGKVVAGMDVVESIQNSPTDERDRPTTPVVINSLTVE